MGEMVSFPANGSTGRGYLARPGTAGGRGVVVIQEWWGLNDQIKGVAERFAAEGFPALAPDLYHGKVTKAPDEAQKLLMALDIATAEQDLRGAVRWLRDLTGAPVGTVGYCMGGALSLFAACVNGADVGAAVVFYGGHPKVTYDFERLTAPVLGHWAEKDDWANASIPVIRAGLEPRGKPFEFHTYPGTGHAFANEQRPAVHHPAADAESFRRTVAFLRRHLA